MPELLQMLEVSGCIVTIDAIGCQKSIAQLLTERGADYVLALKKNQAQLYDEVRTMFTCERESEFEHLPHDYHQTVEKDTRPSKRTMVASKSVAAGLPPTRSSSTT